MDLGANVALQDNDGDTPLHCAAQGSHAKACQVLIDAGAKLKQRNKVRARDTRNVC